MSWRSTIGALMCAAATGAVAAGEAGAELAIPHESYTLDNGLTVLVSEDHTLPWVHVELWYGVGSQDDGPGRAGLAHLFEHLMFVGPAGLDGDYHTPLHAVGAQVNAYTNTDRTVFWEGLPAEQLPLALWMEADRMARLLKTLDADELRTQQDVVRNERRENYEHDAARLAWLALHETLYPEGHPYRYATIGLHEDIAAITLEDVRAFFRAQYHPGNAVLAVVGDVDPAATRALIEQTLGVVPAGEAPPTAEPPPVRRRAQGKVTLEHDVPRPVVYVAWPSPARHAPGDAELTLLAEALTSSKNSTLWSQFEGELDALSIRQRSRELGSLFVVEARVRKDHDPDDLVQAIDDAVAEAAFMPMPDVVLELARTAVRRGLVDQLATTSGRAHLLQEYHHTTGDAGALAAHLARLDAITPQDVQRAARRHLPLKQRVVVTVVPAGYEPTETREDD